MNLDTSTEKYPFFCGPAAVGRRGRKSLSIGKLHKNRAKSLCKLPIAKLPKLCYTVYRKKERGTQNEERIHHHREY